MIQYQHTPASIVASSVGISDSQGSHNQDKNLGVKLVDKEDPNKFAKPSCPKPFKYGYQRSHDQSFSHNFPKKEKREKQGVKSFVYKKGLNKPPTRPEKIGGGDHNHYKEKGGTLQETFL